MKVLFRLRGLDTRQHQNVLLATDECGLLYPSVEYKGSTHDKDGHNVDLKIETEVDMFARGIDKIPVHRDVVDKLWEILGIFPRTEVNDDFVKELIRKLEFIRGVAKTIELQTSVPATENAHGIQSVCDQLLEKLRTGLM